MKPKSGLKDYFRKLEGLPPTPTKQTTSYPDHFSYTGGFRFDRLMLEESVRTRTPSSVSSWFGWHYTPQGAIHWMGIERNIQPMTEEDWLYCEYILEHHTGDPR